jgi:hypothetical protein
MTRISTSYRIVYDAPAAAQVLAIDSRGVPHVLFATPYDDMDEDPRDVEALALMYTVGPAP